MLQQFSSSWTLLSDKLQSWLDNIILILPNLTIAILVLALSVFASRFLKKVVSKSLRKITDNGTISSVISNIITAAFLVVMLFVVLGLLNLDKALTSLLAGAGVIGLAVGLALQDPLINLFSGIMMSVRDYYKEGDLVKTNGHLGKIGKITLRSTILLQPDGQEVIIPNKDVLQNPLVNYTHNGRRRIEISCGVAYSDDLEAVRKTAIEAIENNIELDNNRPVALYFTEFGDSSINFVLHFWQDLTRQADYLGAKSKAIICLKKAFDQQGFTIPFPIRTLDFGVVGGERLDQLYPLQKMVPLNSNGSAEHKKSPH